MLGRDLAVQDDGSIADDNVLHITGGGVAVLGTFLYILVLLLFIRSRARQEHGVLEMETGTRRVLVLPTHDDVHACRLTRSSRTSPKDKVSEKRSEIPNSQSRSESQDKRITTSKTSSCLDSPSCINVSNCIDSLQYNTTYH